MIKEGPVICNGPHVKEVCIEECLSGAWAQDPFNHVMIDGAWKTVVFVGLCSLHLRIVDKIEAKPAAKPFYPADLLGFKRASFDQKGKGTPAPDCRNMPFGVLDTYGLKSRICQCYQPWFVAGRRQEIPAYR